MIYWTYYKGLLPFAVSLGLLATILLGIGWGYLMFVTIVPLITHLSHKVLKPGEKIFYLNLGIGPGKLLMGVLCFQFVISVPLFLIILGALSLFFGGV